MGLAELVGQETTRLSENETFARRTCGGGLAADDTIAVFTPSTHIAPADEPELKEQLLRAPATPSTAVVRVISR